MSDGPPYCKTSFQEILRGGLNGKKKHIKPNLDKFKLCDKHLINQSEYPLCNNYYVLLQGQVHQKTQREQLWNLMAASDTATVHKWCNCTNSHTQDEQINAVRSLAL